MNSEKTFSIWLIDSRRVRWNWLFIPVMVVGTPLSSVALGAWFDYMFGMVFGVIGVLAGVSMWLGAGWYFDKWISDAAIATVKMDSIVVVKQTSEVEDFLFSELVKYRVLTSFRGRASLRLIAENGRRSTLRGNASPEFTALIKEFDAAVLQYERLSGKRVTRIDMG